MSGPQRHLALRFVAVFLAATALVDLLAMLAIVGYHAYVPGAPTGVLDPMTYVLAGASGAAVLSGLLYSLLRYPAHRRTVLLLSLIVVGLLAAHMYTINNPPLSASGTLAGVIGRTASDNQVTLTTVLHGSQLDVAVADTGGSAIGSLSLAVGGVALPQSGFAVQPSATSPIQPGSQDSGSWTLAPGHSASVTLDYQYLTCYATDKKVDGCIIDEVYYVPAAQTLLSGEKCAPYADNCNLEHPFLSKAFIAAGISIFGNDGFGWRFFNVILGTFSIPLLFGICWVVSKNERLALYAAFLLAFETLFFVHSAIAVIDVGSIFFSLLGFLFYFSGFSWWKLDSMMLTGVAFAVAALAKETTIFIFITLVLYHLFFAPGTRRQVFGSTAELLLVVFVVFAVGMQAYDGAFGAGVATTFIGQIDFILRYGSSLVMTPKGCPLFKACDPSSMGWIDSTFNTPITPLNWITYYSPIGYLVTNVRVTSGSTSFSYVSTGYYGVTNQFEVWLVYIWGAYVVYLLFKNRGRFAAESDSREFRLAGFAFLWFMVVFLGYCGLFLYGRVTYPYYLISAVPALSTGAAYLLTRAWFPRPVAYILLAGVFLWFFIFYPDKSFLPVQVRAWLGH